MLKSAAELFADLLLAALTLLIGSCILGSILAALRAVGDGSHALGVRESGFRGRWRSRSAGPSRPEACESQIVG